jgi:hypothetical protein
MKILVREMCEKERVIFSGTCENLKQANYMYRALSKMHKIPLIMECDNV